MPNRLSTTTSPYLQQHADNPVDWYPWGEEALQKARREDKPIFLSIGYAACHWCHVMAHESFEDPETAAIMNAHFVNIKVDREERPDIDSIYMQAVVTMTGQGGWPTSVFLTPDLRPFYGGTYYPPEPRHGLPSFKQVLLALAEAWQNRREEIVQVSAGLFERLQAQAKAPPADTTTLSPEAIQTAVQALLNSYDWTHGGWGQAPKFPQPMSIEVLLRSASRDLPLHPAPEEIKSSTKLTAALHALEAMARGGMYDVVGGGFARYATDNRWLVPHFEKMLYDNAQLARVYLHAWQITRQPFYRRICEETLAFVIREMTHPDGGFYSSLDADSEGEEGKFYVWREDEIQDALGADFPLFKAAYGLTSRGNWEGKIVLQRALDDTTLAARFGLDPEQVTATLSRCHARLLETRAARVRPATDDKVLTAWNGLMLATFAEAARVFAAQPGHDDRSHQHNDDLAVTYLNVATRNATFLLSALQSENTLRRSWRNGKTTKEVYLEDYAALILGLLELYQTDFDNQWFEAALELAGTMITRFSDPDGGFFDTPVDGEALLVRPKDLQDNATPCGNSLAAEALFILAAFTGKQDYRQRAEQALGLVAQVAPRYPAAFGRWLWAADFGQGPVKQVAVIGDPALAETRALLAEVRAAYHPRLVMAAAPYPPPENAPPLLFDKPMLNGKSTVYLCEGFVCKQPVTSAEALRQQLNTPG